MNSSQNKTEQEETFLKGGNTIFDNYLIYLYLKIIYANYIIQEKYKQTIL